MDLRDKKRRIHAIRNELFGLKSLGPAALEVTSKDYEEFPGKLLAKREFDPATQDRWKCRIAELEKELLRLEAETAKEEAR